MVQSRSSPGDENKGYNLLLRCHPPDTAHHWTGLYRLSYAQQRLPRFCIGTGKLHSYCTPHKHTSELPRSKSEGNQWGFQSGCRRVVSRVPLGPQGSKKNQQKRTHRTLTGRQEVTRVSIHPTLVQDWKGKPHSECIKLQHFSETTHYNGRKTISFFIC